MTECFARRLKFGVCVQPQPYGSRQCRFSESKSSKIALTDALSFRPNTTFPVYCSVRLDYSVRRQNPSFDYLRDFFTFLCFDEQADKRLCKHKKTAFAVFLRLSKNSVFRASSRLKPRFQSNLDEKPRLTGTIFRPLYNSRGTQGELPHSGKRGWSGPCPREL